MENCEEAFIEGFAEAVKESQDKSSVEEISESDTAEKIQESFRDRHGKYWENLKDTWDKVTFWN